MLKLLLGHWKSHRKKPPLLPEDGDIRFEDPSTINPLFEDSDSSISSSKRPTDIATDEQNQNTSQEENEQNKNENDASVVNELIDVSIPTQTKDAEETVPKVLEAASTDAESVSKDIEAVPKGAKTFSEKTVLKDETTDPEKFKSVLASQTVSELENVQKDNPSKKLEHKDSILVPSESSSHKDTPDISSKNQTEISEVKSEEKMRIYDQPSTSAIKQTKSSADKIANEGNTPQTSVLKSAAVQNVKKHENSHKQSLENKTPKLGSNNAKSALTSSKLDKENSFPSKPVQSNKEPVNPEKPAKLRARAIDELIKKFQGPTTDNKVENQITKSDAKGLPKQPIEIEKAVINVSKPESKNLPSPSKENDKNANKIPKSENKELPKTVNSVTQSNVSNKSEIEREALSNIFKFPPPPPLEQLQNESSLHGKAVKEKKINNPLLMSNKMKDNADNSKANEPGKTRSDSSLDRTRTASSDKLKDKERIERDNQNETNIKIQEPTFKEKVERIPTDKKNSPAKDLPVERSNNKESKTESELSRSKILKEPKSSVSKIESVEKNNPETKLSESQPQTSNDNIPTKKESPISIPKPEANTSTLHKSAISSDQKNVSKSPVQKQKSSISKTSPKVFSTNENENVKSHSEDSGITRGDQISSETTQETPLGNPSDEASAVQNPTRKNRKDKKLKSINKKVCKNCRRTHDDSVSIKRGQCDDYYDGLTGVRHLHKGRHSDSWNSDLSWEEKELLRRLRSKRGTVRSNTPSTRSRHSRHRFINEDHFRRHHNFRRSVSDESTFYGSSLCSCDECWAMYVKDYAYGRASLRGMSPIQELCTCRTSRHNFLGRRVKFRSDTIHEGSPSERTTRTTTPAPPAENKEEDETDDKSSQLSSKTNDKDSVHKHPDGIKDKKSKVPEEAYRFVTPWELEEWDLLMRKHLLQRRRRRARCMGIMALAMVVFVGLVVAILMVYLRRKVI